MEMRDDYVQSFKLNQQHPQLRKNIFNWIDSTFGKLSLSTDKSAIFDRLKEEIRGSVKELMIIDIDSCVRMIDQWFENSYQEQLILVELSAYPEVQFNYIRKLINQHEGKIAKTLEESILDADKVVETERYKKYMVQHIKLMCIYDKESVHDHVKKDIYPIEECLAICKKNGAELAVAVL